MQLVLLKLYEVNIKSAIFYCHVCDIGVGKIPQHYSRFDTTYITQK